MVSMEIAMNATDLIFAGGVLTITIIPFMLLAGFITLFHIIITDSKNITSHVTKIMIKENVKIDTGNIVTYRRSKKQMIYYIFLMLMVSVGRYILIS